MANTPSPRRRLELFVGAPIRGSCPQGQGGGRQQRGLRKRSCAPRLHACEGYGGMPLRRRSPGAAASSPRASYARSCGGCKLQGGRAWQRIRGGRRRNAPRPGGPLGLGLGFGVGGRWCGLCRASLGHPWARVRGGPTPGSTLAARGHLLPTYYRLPTDLLLAYCWLTPGRLLAYYGLTTGLLLTGSTRCTKRAARLA